MGSCQSLFEKRIWIIQASVKLMEHTVHMSEELFNNTFQCCVGEALMMFLGSAWQCKRPRTSLLRNAKNPE